MSKLKRILMSVLSSVACYALICGIFTSNSACGMIFHQPKEPEKMNKFKI